jgi:hypothetical protein
MMQAAAALGDTGFRFLHPPDDFDTDNPPTAKWFFDNPPTASGSSTTSGSWRAPALT